MVEYGIVECVLQGERSLHAAAVFFFKKVTVEGLITTKVLKGQRHCCRNELIRRGGRSHYCHACMSSRELRSGAARELECAACGSRERRTAKQGMANWQDALG